MQSKQGHWDGVFGVHPQLRVGFTSFFGFFIWVDLDQSVEKCFHWFHSFLTGLDFGRFFVSKSLFYEKRLKLNENDESNDQKSIWIRRCESVFSRHKEGAERIEPPVRFFPTLFGSFPRCPVFSNTSLFEIFLKYDEEMLIRLSVFLTVTSAY